MLQNTGTHYAMSGANDITQHAADMIGREFILMFLFGVFILFSDFRLGWKKKNH